MGLLAGAVAGIHSMTDEHFGISVVEYMAAGAIPIGGCDMQFHRLASFCLSWVVGCFSHALIILAMFQSQLIILLAQKWTLY